MQTQHVDTPEEAHMMKLLGKIQTLEAQKSLLIETSNNKDLLVSKIISSLQPRIGKRFSQNDIESRKWKILEETRKKLIRLAIEEKNIELSQTIEKFNQIRKEYIDANADHETFLSKLEKYMNAITHRLNINMNKKITFHLGRQQPLIEFVKKKMQAKKKRKWTANRKKKNKLIYRQKVRTRNQNRIQTIVTKIKQENTVINLSSQEVPDAAYIFLSKGLGYVPTQKVDLQDLKYDTTEFIRKLEWKAFFKLNPGLETDNKPTSNIHRDIKVSGFTHPEFSSPLLEEIKTKLYGWIANHTASNPKPNMSPLDYYQFLSQDSI